MAIYAIGDLHLSFKENKPMDIFGENWKNHEEKIKKNWIENINDDDIVILPGDFSWAMHLEDTELDFKYLNDNLPQVKVYPLEGTYLVWLDFSAFGLTKEKLEEKLTKECNVFMDEGYMFGDEGNQFERINIACPTKKIIEALDRICRVFNKKD